MNELLFTLQNNNPSQNYQNLLKFHANQLNNNPKYTNNGHGDPQNFTGYLLTKSNKY